MNRKKIKQIIAINLTIATITLSGNTTTHAYADSNDVNSGYVNSITSNSEFSLDATTFNKDYTNRDITQMKLENGKHYYYDGTTIKKASNVLPLNINTNNQISHVLITLNGDTIDEESIDSQQPSWSFNKDMTLTTGIDNIISITVTDINGEYHSYEFAVTVDTVTHQMNSQAFDSNGNYCDLESKNGEYYYTSKDNFSLSTTFDKLSANDLDINSFKATCDDNNISYNLDTNKNSFIINNIPTGKHVIKLTYLDKANHQYSSTINTYINSEIPEIYPDSANTTQCSIKNSSAILKLDVNDSIVTSENFTCIQTQIIPAEVNGLSLYYNIKDSNGNMININNDDIKISKVNNILYVDYSKAINELSNLSDGAYTLNYIYYNDIKTPANSKNSFETYSFNVDNTAPNVNVKYSDKSKSINENNHGFTLFNGDLTLLTSQNNESSNVNGNYISFTSDSADIKDYKVSIRKLEYFDDSKNPSAFAELDSTNSSMSISNEGYYEISYIYTDTAGNNISRKVYVAIDKNSPKVNMHYFNTDNQEIAIKNNSTNQKATPYIEINDVSFDANSFSNSKFDILTNYIDEKTGEIKQQTYNKDNLIEVSALPSSEVKYGTKYYYLGTSNNNVIEKTLLEDSKVNISYTVKDVFDKTNTNKETLFIESSAPTLNFMMNNSQYNPGTIVFCNNTKIPKIDIDVTNSIAGGTCSFSVKNKNESSANENSKDITSKFKISSSVDEKTFETHYTISFNGSVDELNSINGTYTLSFTYTSNSGNSITETRSFVIDTMSPSFILNFRNNDNNTSDSPVTTNDSNFSVTGSDNSKLRYTSSKDSSGKIVKRIYCGYDNLHLYLNLSDNSFDMDGIKTESDLSQFNIYIDGHAVDFDAKSRTVQLLPNSIETNMRHILTLSAKDKAQNQDDETFELIMCQTPPSLKLDLEDDNNKNLDQNNYNKKVDEVYYFKQNITPYIEASSIVCKADELMYYVKINDIDCNSKLISQVTGNKYTGKLSSLGEGKYTIAASFADFAGNKTEQSINCVVDSTAPIGRMYMFNKSATLYEITNENDAKNLINAKGKMYIVVQNEPNFDLQETINSFKVFASNNPVISPNDKSTSEYSNLSEITNFSVKDVTNDMKSTFEIAGNETILEVSSNDGQDFADGYYNIQYSLSDYSGNKTSYNKNLTIDSANCLSVNIPLEEVTYSRDKVEFDVKVDPSFSGYQSSAFEITKDDQEINYNDYNITITDNFNNPHNGGVIHVKIPLSDSEMKNEGKYQFSVRMINNVGISYTNTKTIIMDRTKADLKEFNLDCGKGQKKDDVYYSNSNNLGINFGFLDNLSGENTIEVLVNGVPVDVIPDTNNEKKYYIPDNLFINEDRYEITLICVDKAGNKAEYKKVAVVDKTAPTVSIDGFNGVTDSEDKMLYINSNITPSVSVYDQFGEDNEKRKTYLDSSEFSSVISENGHHIYQATAVDLAGNSSSKQIEFVLDTIAPDISLSNVENYMSYNTSVSPTFSTSDSNANIVAYLNGSLFTDKSVNGDGDYELKLVCTDKAKNVTEKVLHFTIDTVSPVISIFGINENQVNGISTPDIKVNESNVDILAYLNGEYYYGGAINDSGKYELMVKCVDKAGNVSQKIVSFSVDSELPQIVVNNIENNQIYSSGLQPAISATKDAKVTMKLNGDDYDGSPITKVGKYQLEISAVDQYNNKSNATYNFTIKNPDDVKIVSQVKDVKSPTSKESKKSSSSLTKKILASVAGGITLVGGAFAVIFIKKK